MKIKITKITDEKLMREACEFTSGKRNNVSLDRMYRSGHSPSRTQMFVVRMYDIPYYSSVHFCRHKIGVEHFVKSSRAIRDIESIDQRSPVNHMMLINAQSLINMSHMRLCSNADLEVQNIMCLIKNQIKEIDKDLAEYLVPSCQYKNRCDEFKSCGRVK